MKENVWGPLRSKSGMHSVSQVVVFLTSFISSMVNAVPHGGIEVFPQ